MSLMEDGGLERVRVSGTAPFWCAAGFRRGGWRGGVAARSAPPTEQPPTEQHSTNEPPTLKGTLHKVTSDQMVLPRGVSEGERGLLCGRGALRRALGLSWEIWSPRGAGLPRGIMEVTPLVEMAHPRFAENPKPSPNRSARAAC